MTLGPRTAISPTVPGGTSAWDLPTTRISTPTAGWPHERMNGVSRMRSSCGSSVVIGVVSVVPYTCSSSAPGKACWVRLSVSAEMGEAPWLRYRNELTFGGRGEHGGDQERVRDLLALDKVDRQVGVEPGHDDVGAADPDGGQRGEYSAGMEHRGGHEPPRLPVKGPGGHEMQRTGDQAPVSVHHALRRPRGTGGIKQGGQIVLGYPVPQGHLVGRGDQVLVVIRHRQHVPDSRGAWVVTVGEQHADPGVLQDGTHLRGSQPRVDRDQHVTRSREPQVELEVTVRVERDDPDAVMRCYAELAHRAGQPAASRAKLGIGTATVLAHNGRGPGGGAEGSAERLDECVRRARLQTRW